MHSRKMTTVFVSALRVLSLHAPAVFMTSVSMSELVLTPMAVLAGVLGAWRLGSDPGWTSDFFIADGLFSHYQFWFATAIGAQLSVFILNRWVTSRNISVPARPDSKT